MKFRLFTLEFGVSPKFLPPFVTGMLRLESRNTTLVKERVETSQNWLEIYIISFFFFFNNLFI